VITTILDPEDSRLDPFRRIRDRDLRADGGRFVVESPRVVSRFLTAVREDRARVDAVLLAPDQRLVDPREIPAPVYLADLDLMTAVSGYHFHGGAIAVGIRPRRDPDLADLTSNIPASGPLAMIALAGVTSMDNIGGIFRIAAALGASGIVLDDDASDPMLRRTIRISMGQVFRVPWARVGTLGEAIPELASTANIETFAIENLEDATPLHQAAFPARVMLVIGNEGHGIPPEILERCPNRIRIEGPSDLPSEEGPGGEDERSLNAATAAAIALHAALRRRD
jgi:tRNA G18 (ribose-2'-O)-methylase SpoU